MGTQPCIESSFQSVTSHAGLKYVGVRLDRLDRAYNAILIDIEYIDVDVRGFVFGTNQDADIDLRGRLPHNQLGIFNMSLGG